ncbi:peptidoglycan DD-metalloendopeptidase family protein [Marinobacterium jannaschii]|uniref:peptidoglycan DD-metalloendopeptidase family protein n=1 Tax=Marinobacterium jannaschii TaxID=64970 RepID=UPI0004858890|nr:peptidoglycan DD-metalloendopeptidase family protein [Marinobacterium jannaschii]
MKGRLIVTLTTVRGSRQYSLGQIAKYVLLAFLLAAAASFFISNVLLFQTSDDLAVLEQNHQLLEQNHQRLEADYASIADSQQSYQQQLEHLTLSLSQITSEKQLLEQENLRIGELNQSLDKSFSAVESLLGLPASDKVDRERAQELEVIAQKRLFFLHSIPNGKPITSPRITDRFGYRIHPVAKKRIKHAGIDFKAKTGTPVYATADGVVEFAGYHKKSGYGYLVIIQHNLGFKTYFAHLSKVKVSSRQLIKKGQLIGLSGNSGISTGPHLHYEVRHLHTPINPEPFIAWGLNNFESLFTEVKHLKWASLKEMYPLNQNALP